MRLFRVELDNLSKVKSQKQMFMIELILQLTARNSSYRFRCGT